MYRIMHQGADGVGDQAQEDHRYPFAGGPNAIVKLAVVDVATQKVRWLDLASFMGMFLLVA